MSKAARGSKQVCTNCGARFYDLNREPVQCPLCETVLEQKPAPPAPEPKVEAKPESAPAPAKEQAEEKPAAKKKASDPEFISLEEVEEPGDDDDVPDLDDDDVVAIDDDDDSDIPAADEDDNTFLESEDDGDTDVKGIIGAPIKPTEES